MNPSPFATFPDDEENPWLWILGGDITPKQWRVLRQCYADSDRRDYALMLRSQQHREYAWWCDPRDATAEPITVRGWSQSFGVGFDLS